MWQQQFQQALEVLTVRAHAIDMRRYENVAVGLLPALIHDLSALLSNAISLFTDIIEHYSKLAEHVSLPAVGTSEDTITFCREIDYAVTHLSGAERVADLCFMARWELQAKWDGFERFRFTDDRWTIVAECGSARRRLIKASVAVETALSEHEGLVPRLADLYVTEVQRSLRVRRAYAGLRRAILRNAPSSPRTTAAALQHALKAVRDLVQGEAYTDLRVSDRVTLRALTDRVVLFVRRLPHDHQEGSRLWKEMESFSELLLAVNKRAELVDHDSTLITRALQELELVEPGGSPAAQLLQQLRALEGRDSNFDVLLFSKQDRTASDWRDAVRRLATSCTSADESHELQQHDVKDRVVGGSRS